MTNTLTKIFSKLAAIDDTRESLGSQILTFLVDRDCKTLDEANEQFGVAYDENGWSRTAGRPKDGSKEKAAPPTVKNYVTAFRRAYKARLNVLGFKTVGEMRQAIRELREAEKEAHEKPAALKGVQISKDDSINGALVHDIAVVLTHLPDDKKEEFEAKLQRLLSQYIKKAPSELRLVA